MSIRLRLFLLACACTVAMSGCGQSGPLYFRADPPADQLPPSKRMQAAQPAAVSAGVVPVPSTPAASPAPASSPAGSPGATTTSSAPASGNSSADAVGSAPASSPSAATGPSPSATPPVDTTKKKDDTAPQ